jgi:hypothetical protein
MLHKHFKGKYYLVLGRITNGDTCEECIVYLSLYDKPRLFVRTVADFYAWINKPEYNYIGSRFTKVTFTSYLKQLFK